jgi:hypothetical protein
MDFFCGEREVVFMKASISHTALIGKNYIMVTWEGTMTDIFQHEPLIMSKKPKKQSTKHLDFRRNKVASLE